MKANPNLKTNIIIQNLVLNFPGIPKHQHSKKKQTQKWVLKIQAKVATPHQGNGN